MSENQISLEQIDAIIFDLGGVIINICYENTIRLFSELCDRDIHHFYSQSRQVDLFDQYEVGLISSPDFRDGLRSLLQLPTVSDNEVDNAWNAMLLDIPLARIEFLRDVRQSRQIFLLSNTNAIHKCAFDNIFRRTFGDKFPDLPSLFDEAYFSHLVGDRKPNPSIFKRVIEDQSLVASRTLFIDDSLQHIEGAREVGLQVFHMHQGLSLETIIWEL